MDQREELEAAVPHREQSVREVRSYNKLAGGGGGEVNAMASGVDSTSGLDIA